MNKVFIFDFDGTLADTIPLTLDAFSAAYSKLGISAPSVSEFKSVFGAEEKGIFQTLNPDCADEIYDAYLDQYDFIMRSRHESPFDGIPELLQDLKDGDAKLSLVTGKGVDTAKMSLEFMDLGKYFDFVECGDLKGSVKPQKIRKILDSYSVSPSDTFYIGDSPRDVTDSREAGVYPLAAAWSRIVTREHFSSLHPLDIFTSIDQIRVFIKEKCAMKNL